MLFSTCIGDQVKESDLGNFSAPYSKLLLGAGENTGGVQFLHKA